MFLDLVTQEGLESVFKGLDKAFLMSPPGYADQFKLLSPLIKDAKKHGLKKVVLMSAFGANSDSSSPFRKAEILLEESGLNYNIVRPNWFMQNFNTFWLQGIKEQNKILLPAGNAKTSFIDVRDIAEVCAKLLTSDHFNNKAFDITGPEALDHDEVAKIISHESGKKISYKEISPDELNAHLLKAGLPNDYSTFLVKIFGFLKLGYNSAVTPFVKEILGKEARKFKNYAHDYKSYF